MNRTHWGAVFSFLSESFVAHSEAFNKLRDSNQYVMVTGVPVFDAHAEFDKDGNLLRKFGKKELQEICDKTNKRAESTGTLALLSPGHTIPSIDGKPAKETDQPKPWGVCDGFRVEKFGKENKDCIFVDWLIQKEKSDEAKSFPHRSIELWPKDGIIDWIAQLRRTPQRDLGLLRWSREANRSVPVESPRLFSQIGTELCSVLRYDYKSPSGDLKLCYSMENSINSLELNAMPLKYEADPTLAPDAMGSSVPEDKRKQDEEQAEHDKFCKHCDRYMKEKYKPEFHAQYAMPEQEEHKEDADNSKLNAAEGAPSEASSGSTFLPGEDKKDEEKVHMSKNFTKENEQIHYARFQKELESHKAEIASLKAKNDESEKKARYARAEQKVQAFVAKGYKMLADYDREQFANLNEEGQAKYAKMIEETRKQDDYGFPVQGPMIPTTEGNRGDPLHYRKISEQAVEMAEKDGISFQDALAKLKN